MRRRIWCELLPAEVLGEEATIDLLDRHRVEPIIALPPARESEAMTRALAKLSARGIKVGLWPLLEDHEGYWPSLHNAEAFARRVRTMLPAFEQQGIKISTLAFDLEPPLDVSRAFLEGGAVPKLKAMAAGLVSLATVKKPAGADLIAELDRELRAANIETLAAVMPTLILDLASRSYFWERVFKTPLQIADWSVMSPMLYTTLVADNLPSKSKNAARMILCEGASLLVRAVGVERASVSIGLVTTGKFGNEPFYESPEELALDVGAARAGGVDDLALFSLEGVLSRGSPEAWLSPFTRAEAKPPEGPRVVSSLVRTAAWASTPLRLIR